MIIVMIIKGGLIETAATTVCECFRESGEYRAAALYRMRKLMFIEH